MAENIHFEADNTVVVQNGFGRCVIVALAQMMREALTTFLFEFHQQHGYSFETILGNQAFLTDLYGPIETHRVICDTAQRHSEIPVRLLRKMVWSHAGPNPRAERGIIRVTSYLAHAFFTPIPIGLDARTVRQTNRIQVRNAEVSLEENMNFITLGYEDLNRLRFFNCGGE